MKNMFTKKEIKAVKDAVRDINDVGVITVGLRQEKDPQREAFFGKAKLWNVIKEVIKDLYIEKLKAGELSLRDREGREYGLSQGS
jgi:hypothetical protein